MGEKLVDFRVTPASDSLSLFTANQKIFWQKLYGESKIILPLQREEFEPQDFKKYLPNIWLGDLIFGEEQRLIDVMIRLMGTNLSQRYGERTSNNLLSDDDEKSFRNQMKCSFDRFSFMLNTMIRTEAPVYTSLSCLEKDKDFLQVSALMFPMCKNSKSINMMLEYVEITYKN